MSDQSQTSVRQPSHDPHRRCRSCTAVLTLMSGSAEAKMAQSSVKYQATPKDGKQCDGCNLFVAPNACKSVAGDISPKGWCSLWVKKARKLGGDRVLRLFSCGIIKTMQ